ncbi:MAG: LysR family transcriptional regulator [Pseudomonadota bacterium]
MDRFAELQAFVAVVEAGGFSSAARALGQSRSSVNRLVIGLETRLGVQLLHRTTRSVVPNATGQALYERARRLVDDVDEVEQAVGPSPRAPAGILRLGAPLPFGDLDFSRLVTAFMARHPSVQLEVQFENRRVDPGAEGHDLLIRIAAPDTPNEPDEPTRLIHRRILPLEHILCAAPSYLVRCGRPHSLAALADHAALFLQRDAARPGWQMAGPDGPVAVPIRPVLVANTFETLLTAVRAGLGIAVLPAVAVRTDLAAGRLVALMEEHRLPACELQLVYPSSRHLSARVRVFVEFVEAWCRTLSGSGDGVTTG